MTSGDVGAGDAHADADVGALDAGRVVDAVAGHGGDVVVAAPGVYYAGLVLGLDAGVDGYILELAVELLVAHLVELAAGDGFGVRGEYAELAGYGHGGVYVVAGYHYRADTGAAALLDGGLYLRAHRVYHAGEADKDEVVLEAGGTAVGGYFRPLALARREDAQRPVGHGLVGGEYLGALGVGHGLYLSVFEVADAELEHLVGSALGVLYDAVRGLVDGAHHLAHGVEGSLADARLRGLEAGLSEPEAVRVVDEGALGRLADGLSVIVLLRVGAEAHRRGEEGLVVAVVVDDGHLVLGERTGLVRAYDLGAAEGLDGGQAADYSVAPGHVGDAYREHDRDDGREPLGYGGDGQRDGDHEAVEHDVEVEPAGAQYLHREYDDADSEHEPGQYPGELAELYLQRGLPLLGAGEGVGYLAHLGVHAGGGYDGAAASVGDRGAHVAHILAVAEGHVGGVLEAVCGDGVAGLEQHNVADDELRAGHDTYLAVAQNAARGGAHGLQSLYRLLGLALLIDPEYGVDEHDDEDDNRIGYALEPLLVDAGDGAYRGGDDKYDYHRVRHLGEEAFQERILLLGGELVASVALEAFLRLGTCKAGCRAFHISENLGRVLTIVLHSPIHPFFSVLAKRPMDAVFCPSMSLAI